jgi:hypothetical protein
MEKALQDLDGASFRAVASKDYIRFLFAIALSIAAIIMQLGMVLQLL